MRTRRTAVADGGPLPVPVLAWRATRPLFYPVSVLPVALGALLAAHAGHAIDAVALGLALVGAMAAHGGANALNDYWDHASGADALNLAPLSPYAGGSRLIQRGLVDSRAVARLGGALLGLAIVIGLTLVVLRSLWLLPIGLAGTACAWAYTAPPLQLAYRGWGESAIVLGFGVLPVTGTWCVFAGTPAGLPVLAGIATGLLTSAVLLANEIADRHPDRGANKRTLVVLAGEARAPALLALVQGAGVVAAAATALALGSRAAALAAVVLGAALASRTVLGARAHLRRGADLRPALRAAIATQAGVTAVLLAAAAFR